MARVRKFLELSPADRRLFIRAWLWLGFIRLWFWLLPFGSHRRLLARLSQAPPGGGRNDASFPERVVKAVSMASGYVPQATCLVQALAAQGLLRGRGWAAEVRLGVGRDVQGQFLAHAWLEKGGRVIIGDSKLERYLPLPAKPQRSCAP